ncbi:MAG: ABC transporter ATP-binding protein [Gammaproteobacteria bacterium]
MSKQEMLKGTIHSLLSAGSADSGITTTDINKGKAHMSERNGVSINLKEVTHRYNSKSPLTFEKLDMQSDPGESLVIIGRSGCGKSTLLHIIAGLLGGFNGTVEVNNKAVKAASSKWIMMFQAPHLFPWMTVEQNVGTGLRFAGWSKDKIADRVKEAISLVHMEEYAHKNTQDLSGGQQQRVALARSLVMEPEMLLLDEPFSALDAFTRASLQKDVRAISKKMGFNIVMVTHDIDEAVIMADRTLIMAGSPGKMVHDLKVDLPDPRDREDPAVQELRAGLMQVFQDAANVS